MPLKDWERLRDAAARKECGGSDGRGDEWLLGGLKGFVDGSLGSHSAAFHQPFDDSPKDRGLLVNTPDDLYRWIKAGDVAGIQVMVHSSATGPARSSWTSSSGSSARTASATGDFA